MKKIIYIGVWILFCFSFIAVNAQIESSLVKIGDQVPDFSIETAEGVINPNSLKGKVVVINFFATWCPPCIKELPLVEKEIWNKYKENHSFKLLVVGRNHTKEELMKFSEDKYSMPFYPDKDRKMYGKFASNTIPRNYVLNRAGEIIYASSGFTMESFQKMLAVIERELSL